MYGTNVATSDLDYKSIFIPRAEDILLQRARHNISTTTKAVKDSRNSAHDVDTEAFALHAWMKLLLEGQTVALDMLFAPPDFVLQTSPDGKNSSLSRPTRCIRIKLFIGYCRTQANKYGIKGSRIPRSVQRSASLRSNRRNTARGQATGLLERGGKLCRRL